MSSAAAASRSAASVRSSATRLVASSILARAESNGALLALEAVDGILQQRPGPAVIAAGSHQHALCQVGGGLERHRPDQPLDVAQRPDSRGRLVELAACDPRTGEQLERGEAIQRTVRRRLAQQTLDELDSPERVASVECQPGAADLRRAEGTDLVEQERGLFRSPLAAPQLGEPEEWAGRPRRA